MAHKSYFFAAGATQKSTLHTPTADEKLPNETIFNLDFTINNLKDYKDIIVLFLYVQKQSQMRLFFSYLS